jgi:BRO family, N-terminal domain
MSIIHCLFKDQEIRFIDGSPVAIDVAMALGYARPADTIRKKVSKKNKGVADLATPGGIQSVVVLKEAGIYQLIFSSKLASAEEFQDWVFEDVLPSIRKTGSYSIEPPTLEPINIFNLDQKTLELLEGWMRYRKFPSLEVAWEEYNQPGNELECFVNPDRTAMLDDRLKAMPDFAIMYLRSLWMMDNLPLNPEYLQKVRNGIGSRENALVAQQFQAQLDRTQLAAAPNQKQLAEIE